MPMIVNALGAQPRVAVRPTVGRRPTTPHMAAGTRSEPPPSTPVIHCTCQLHMPVICCCTVTFLCNRQAEAMSSSPPMPHVMEARRQSVLMAATATRQYDQARAVDWGQQPLRMVLRRHPATWHGASTRLAMPSWCGGDVCAAECIFTHQQHRCTS